MKNATVLKDKTDDSTAEVKSAESPILSDNVEEKITEAPVENIGETEPSVERVSDTEAKDGNVITQNELKAVVENILEAIKKSVWEECVLVSKIKYFYCRMKPKKFTRGF